MGAQSSRRGVEATRGTCVEARNARGRVRETIHEREPHVNHRPSEHKAARTSGGARLVAFALALVVALGAPMSAMADTVTTQIGNLANGADYKVRLAAAIGLTGSGDQRGVAPMTKALSDADKNVRAAAATGLGKLVTAATKAADKTKALTELDRIAKSDPSSTVKSAATKAAAAIRALSGAASAAVAKNGIYIDLKSVALGTGVTAPATLLARMVKTGTKSISKQKVMSSGVMTSWPGGAPSAKDLTANGVDGFQVTGTLVTLSTKVTGSAASVKCELKLVLATFPAASMFGFLNSSATVSAANTPDDIALAGEDCTDAVIDGLIGKIMSTIKTRTGKP